MAQKLRCPKCKTVVKVPEKRDSVRCPECSRKLTASSQSDRRDDLPKKKKKKKPGGVSKTLIYSIVGGVVGVVLLVPIIFGIVWLIKAERRVVVPLAKDGPKNERPDDGRAPPIAPPIPVGPVEPAPPMWKAKPDPAPQARETLPETMRWPLGFAEPLFASADGPFMVDMPYSRVNERFKEKVIDLRTGKEIGSFGKNSPLHSTGGAARLSPDGQYVAGSANKKVEVWKIGGEEPMLKLDLPSYAFWLDFRNAEELVAVTIDNQKPLVVVWKIPDGKERHKVTLPRNPAFDKVSSANGTISPGRKQLAVAVQGELHVVDLETGTHIGTAARPNGFGSGFLFSNDGAELTAVYGEKIGNVARFSLIAWNMNNGKFVRPPAEMNVPNMSGTPLSGPDADTLIFGSNYRLQPQKVAPAQVVDRSSGTSTRNGLR